MVDVLYRWGFTSSLGVGEVFLSRDPEKFSRFLEAEIERMVLAGKSSGPEIVQIFGAHNWAVGDWGWCLHCERCYQVGEFRLFADVVRSRRPLKINLLQLCPYPDCDGDAVIDCWHWEQVREANPSYPEIPLRDVVYHLYG